METRSRTSTTTSSRTWSFSRHCTLMRSVHTFCCDACAHRAAHLCSYDPVVDNSALQSNNLTRLDARLFERTAQMQDLCVTRARQRDSQACRERIIITTPRFLFLSLSDISDNGLAALPDELFAAMPALKTLCVAWLLRFLCLSGAP